MSRPLADALRNVTAAMQKAIDDGYRSWAIDADDFIEVLLAEANELDSPDGSPANETTPQPGG